MHFFENLEVVCWVVSRSVHTQRSTEAHTDCRFRVARIAIIVEFSVKPIVEFRVIRVIRAVVGLPDAASKAPGSVVIRVASSATHVPSSVLTALKNLNQRTFNMKWEWDSGKYLGSGAGWVLCVKSAGERIVELYGLSGESSGNRVRAPEPESQSAAASS